MGHAVHLVKECNSKSAADEKKSAADGGSRLRRQEANTGEELFAVLLRPFLTKDHLETLMAWIADSCARASRASMGANITLPPRRRLTSIPATAGRVLATPWAWGRISVTVDLVITM
jgi:hypothetical protein